MVALISLEFQVVTWQEGTDDCPVCYQIPEGTVRDRAGLRKVGGTLI